VLNTYLSDSQGLFLMTSLPIREFLCIWVPSVGPGTACEMLLGLANIKAT